MKLVRNPQDFSVFCWPAKRHLASLETIVLEAELAAEATRSGILENLGEIVPPEVPEEWGLVYKGPAASA